MTYGNIVEGSHNVKEGEKLEKKGVSRGFFSRLQNFRNKKIIEHLCKFVKITLNKWEIVIKCRNGSRLAKYQRKL